MYNFNTLEDMIKELKCWNDYQIDKGEYKVYRGISKEYYSKWIGFQMLDENKPLNEIDKQAIDFYITYYYYQLKLDYLEDPLLEYVILNFATLNGKKKAIEKLERVCQFIPTGKPTGKLMEYTKQHKNQLFPFILLEFLEFFYYTEQLLKGSYLLKAYRQWLSNSKAVS